MQTLSGRVLVFIVGVCIGLGAVAGAIFWLPDNSKTTFEDQTETSQQSSSHPPLAQSNEPGNATSNWRGKVEIPSKPHDLVLPEGTFERKATIYSIVARLNDDEVFSWIEQSTDPSWKVALRHRTELQTNLFQRVAVTAPDRAIDFALSRDDQPEIYSKASTVLQVWAKTDLEGAIARAKELNDLSWASTVLKARDDLSLERLREIAIELGYERYAFTTYFQNLSKGKIENPRETWYEIVNIATRENFQDTTSFVLRKVAAAWVKKQGLEVLDEVMSSLADDPEYSSALYGVFRELSLNQPEVIFDYIMSNLGDRAADFIGESGMSFNWARKDPQGMLAKVQSLDASRVRENLVRTAVRYWAEDEPLQILERLVSIPPGVRSFASRTAIDELAQTSPNDAIEFILNVEDDTLKTQFAETLVERWVYVDPDAAKDWVLSVPTDDPMRASLVHSYVDCLLRSDLRGAFEFALKQPMRERLSGDGSSVGYEVVVLSRIAFEDVELAVELLPQVRGDGRASAFTSVGRALIGRSKSEQAVRLAEQLPKHQQQQYFQDISMAWVHHDSQEFLEALEHFSSSMKSKIASSVISGIRGYAKSGILIRLTSEEIANIEKHLNEDDRKELNLPKESDRNTP